MTETQRGTGGTGNPQEQGGAGIPRSESAIRLLLARTGDQVVVDEGSQPLALTAIVRERDLFEKEVRVSTDCDERSVVWRAGEPVRIRDERTNEEVATGAFDVVDRELGLTPDGWSEREREVPTERYREVRVDTEARPAVVSVLEWLASTWGIDEDVGNGAWRQRRDEVLATAYRLDQRREGDDSFAIETIEREIIEEALAHARKEESPFENQWIGKIEEQVKTPGYEEFTV